jgi:hypothetical protein
MIRDLRTHLKALETHGLLHHIIRREEDYLKKGLAALPQTLPIQVKKLPTRKETRYG